MNRHDVVKSFTEASLTPVTIMENFSFANPTRIIFGAGTHKHVGAECYYRKCMRVLLHYGGGSIKKSGVYDDVVKSLREVGVHVVELGGVKPNPRVSLVREGIALCRRERVDLILAVGGGSVIDSAKAIALGVPYEGDVWDFYSGKARPERTLPVASILTIPAAGSESSNSSVITNEKGDLKRDCTDGLLYPVFSILNPELAFTVPPYQVASGGTDILSHLMERYFTNAKPVELSDALIEATMRNVIRNLPIVLEKPDNYNAWAEVMWSGCVAHNNLFECGRIGDWASHGIEHELSGIYDVTHGAGLAVVFPSWMRQVYLHDVPRFVRFAVEVWGVPNDYFSPEVTALAGIDRMQQFLVSIGMPKSLGELGIKKDRIAEMASKATGGGKCMIGNFVKLGEEEVEEILRRAL
jgi:alcohol dehydrogenase YqhD (iron-dependent ADH family)